MKSKLIITLIMSLNLVYTVAAQNFNWAKSVGGSNWDYGSAIATDKLGNVYVTGGFRDTADFDPGSNTFNLTSEGNWDIFILKLDENGDFLWAKSIGGVNADFATSITLDDTGNIYITGSFKDTVDFDPGSNIFNLTSEGDSDIFILKLDENGDFLWAKSIGGVNEDHGQSLVLDETGNIYMTGSFKGTVDFDPGSNIFNLTSEGDSDIFILKLDENGDFLWAKSIGGVNEDSGGSLALDETGNIYIAGVFEETVDFDPGSNIFNLTSKGDKDIFILKLDENGDFLWARSMGGTDLEIVHGIAIDPQGNVYSTGVFDGIADFDPSQNTYNLTSANSSIFVSKLNSNGEFIWAKSMGGDYGAIAFDLAIDEAGSVYTTGRFFGTVDFDPGPNNFFLTSLGTSDIFISKLDNNGNFNWALNIGATVAATSSGQSIVLNSLGNIYTTGTFFGTADFNPGNDTYNLTSEGSSDVFILKLHDNVLDINSFSSTASLPIVFPNPSKDFVIITNVLRDSKLFVSDITGKVLFSARVVDDSIRINTSGFANGTYIIRIEGNNNIVSKKLLINN